MTHATLVLGLSHLTASLSLRHVIVVVSVLAAAVNITGIIPQLVTMLRAGSSRGQSPLGWTLAATCSASLLFVNVVGYHALVLAAGNFVSLSGCLSAALVARHFRYGVGVGAEALRELQDAPEAIVSELPAPELQALTGTVLEEQHRRTGEAIPEEIVTEMATREFQALAEVVLEEHRRRTRRSELSLARA